jgi:hypothetical protein
MSVGRSLQTVGAAALKALVMMVYVQDEAQGDAVVSYLASGPELSSGMITLNKGGEICRLTRLYSFKG